MTPTDIPPYGVLIGRMIFIGGLVLALLGLGFLVMLGLAAGSWLAALLFGTLTLAGLVTSLLAVRDLTGQAIEQPAMITAHQQTVEGGNPIYQLGFQPINDTLKPAGAELSYNVTEQDWQSFKVGDRALVRYSPFFKLLVDIRPIIEMAASKEVK